MRGGGGGAINQEKEKKGEEGKDQQGPTLASACPSLRGGRDRTEDTSKDDTAKKKVGASEGLILSYHENLRNQEERRPIFEREQSRGGKSQKEKSPRY